MVLNQLMDLSNNKKTTLLCSVLYKSEESLKRINCGKKESSHSEIAKANRINNVDRVPNSHHPFSWYCIDIETRSCILITSGSERIRVSILSEHKF